MLELMIVIVIVGILASVGIPRYFDAIETAREAEAKGTLAEIYKIEQAYYSVYAAYIPADASLNGDTIGVDLDNDGTNDMSMVVPNSGNFTYGITTALIQATKAGATKNSWQMSLTTGAISTF